MTPVPVEPFSSQLRTALRASGRTQRDIARETGIDVAVLSKFLAGKTGLSVKSIDALFLALHLNVTDRPTRFSRPANHSEGK